MDDKTLIEALKAAGHEEQAKQLRDRQLANQLRDAGHENLAAALEGNGTEPAELTTPRTREQAHGQQVARVIKRDTGRDFTPEAA